MSTVDDNFCYDRDVTPKHNGNLLTQSDDLVGDSSNDNESIHADVVVDSSQDNESIQGNAKIQNISNVPMLPADVVVNSSKDNKSILPHATIQNAKSSNPVVSSVFKKSSRKEIYSALATTSRKGMKLSKNRKRSSTKLNRGGGVVTFEYATKGSSSDKVRKKKVSPVLQLSSDNGGNITVPSASDAPIGDKSSPKTSKTLFDGDSAMLHDKELSDISRQPNSDSVSDREVAIGVEVPHQNLFPLNTDVHGFVDMIHMSAHSFQGHNCILRIVDPVNGYGLAVVLCNNMVEELNRGFDHLLTTIRVHITTIFYSDNTSFVIPIVEKSNDINCICQPHTELMKKEHSLYKQQLRKWNESYNNNWIRGTVIVQAVCQYAITKLIFIIGYF
jgi:hypothetical protein